MSKFNWLLPYWRDLCILLEIPPSSFQSAIFHNRKNQIVVTIATHFI